MPSNRLILCRPLLYLSSVFHSVRVFPNESAPRTRWPKYWSFSFSISPSSEYSGLISFRTGWFELLAVQGTLSSHLQHHKSKASILWCSAFFIVQLLYPYMTTGKTLLPKSFKRTIVLLGIELPTSVSSLTCLASTLDKSFGCHLRGLSWIFPHPYSLLTVTLSSLRPSSLGLLQPPPNWIGYFLPHPLVIHSLHSRELSLSSMQS